jgi:hypothetical protein
VSDGCAVDQATSTVIVYAAPSAGNDGSITVCLNEPFVLWNGLSGNIDANGTWYNASNVALPNAQDTSGALAGQFNYDYIVTSPVCPNDSANVLIIVDGSCDFTAFANELAGQWEIYPNPTTGVLTIANHSGLAISNIEVLDLNGKVILSSSSTQLLQTDIDVTHLQTGMYILQMSIDHQTLSKRFIKQ